MGRQVPRGHHLDVHAMSGRVRLHRRCGRYRMQCDVRARPERSDPVGSDPSRGKSPAHFHLLFAVAPGGHVGYQVLHHRLSTDQCRCSYEALQVRHRRRHLDRQHRNDRHC